MEERRNRAQVVATLHITCPSSCNPPHNETKGSLSLFFYLCLQPEPKWHLSIVMRRFALGRPLPARSDTNSHAPSPLVICLSNPFFCVVLSMCSSQPFDQDLVTDHWVYMLLTRAWLCLGRVERPKKPSSFNLAVILGMCRLEARIVLLEIIGDSLSC